MTHRQTRDMRSQGSNAAPMSAKDRFRVSAVTGTGRLSHPVSLEKPAQHDKVLVSCASGRGGGRREDVPPAFARIMLARRSLTADHYKIK